jgi:4-aminobutyrate aminotransferase-like enzyme
MNALEYMDIFERYILRLRHLRYKVQFTGPTGTNAVEAFDKELIIETSGSRNHVIKCMPPLTITEPELGSGLNRLADSLHACLAQK